MMTMTTMATSPRSPRPRFKARGVSRPLRADELRAQAYAEATAISDLEYWMADVPETEWTIAALVAEARHVLDLHREPMTSSWERLMGFDGPDEQAYAHDTIRACKAFIKRWQGKA